jgi:hypothetical protein
MARISIGGWVGHAPVAAPVRQVWTLLLHVITVAGLLDSTGRWEQQDYVQVQPTTAGVPRSAVTGVDFRLLDAWIIGAPPHFNSAHRSRTHPYDLHQFFMLYPYPVSRILPFSS